MPTRLKLRFDPQRPIADPREAPAYTLRQAAHFLRLPAATIRYWTLGGKPGPSRRSNPVILCPDRERRLLSFLNLAEAHVLGSLRRQHGVSLPQIRRAVRFLQQRYGSSHPLLAQELETDGVSLFVAELGRLFDVSANGQEVMRRILAGRLQRLIRENGEVVALCPFTCDPPHDLASPTTIRIDPRRSFGRPVLASCFIPTAAIASRFRARESPDDLAEDYGCSRSDIEEAIRFELRAPAYAAA